MLQIGSLTLIPHGLVAESSCSKMSMAMDSLSERISERFLVPRAVLSVVEERSFVLLE